MNETMRIYLAALLALALLAVALRAEAKQPPKCDPELGCLIVRPK